MQRISINQTIAGERVNSRRAMQFTPEPHQDKNGRPRALRVMRAADKLRDMLSDGQWHLTVDAYALIRDKGIHPPTVADICRCAYHGRYICIDKGPGITPEIPPAYMAAEQ